MKKFRLTIVFLILLSYLLIIGGEVRAAPITYYRYVVPGGSTESEYCIRSEPCDLRYAIDVVAQSGDIIVVHSGIYHSTLPGEDLIVINKHLTLWGSCEFDSSTPFICYPEQRKSVLDAENTKRVIRIEGTGVEDIYIDGLTIMRGDGTGMVPCYNGMSGCGGGIHATSIHKLTLNNNYIWDNIAGSTNGVGGGLYAVNVDHVLAENNDFYFNQATETGLGGGGGAFVWISGGPHAVEFNKNVFHGNETNTDNTLYSAGGGVLVYQCNNVQISENKFEYNNGIEQNLDLRGTSLFLSSNTGNFVEGNHFRNDAGTSVVALLGNNTNYSGINRNKWWNNMVFFNLDLQGELNVDIFNNFLGRQLLVPESRGGASTLIISEGGSTSAQVQAKILFNTFAGANYGVDVGEYSDLVIYNNIFTELTDAFLLSGTTSTIEIDNNLFHNNVSYNTIGTSPIFEDPKLIDVGNGDFHILPGSGAIDTAIACDFDEDIDGDIRPIGLGPTPYDVGADEYQVINYLPLILQ